jgi:hypothetical protein
MSIQALQTSLQNLIQQPNFSLSSLETLLSPIPLYTNNTIFQSNIAQVVQILTKDRDGNGKFTANDLVLFSKDIVGITALISSLLLILNSLPNITISYTAEDTEQMIFKLIIYVFLVIIPAKTNVVFSVEEKTSMKTSILSVSMMVYTMLIESGLAKKLVSKVLSWFKAELPICLGQLSAIEKKLPSLLTTIRQIVNKI